MKAAFTFTFSWVGILVLALSGTAIAGDGTAQMSKPFDLIDDLGRDANGFPRNPRWHGGRPDAAVECKSFPARWFKTPDPKLKCTNDPVYVDQRDGSIICGPNRYIEGHVNWGPATFEGCVRKTKSYFDGDITWDMETRECRIITEQESRGTLHCEADSDGTVDRFDTQLWRDIRKTPDKTVDRYAVISGLLNLDNVHHAYSELHPIYAFAVLAEEECENGRCGETWAFFVRNWGDQGYCSTRADHKIINLDRLGCNEGEQEFVIMRIEMPLRRGIQVTVTPVEKIQSIGATGAPNPRWSQNQDYVTLEFALPRLVKAHAIYYGAVNLELTREADYDPMTTCAGRQTCGLGAVETMALKDTESCTYENIYEYLTEGVEVVPVMEEAFRAPPVEVNLELGRFEPCFTSAEEPQSRMADPGFGLEIDETTCAGVKLRRNDLGNTERIKDCYPNKRLLKRHIRKMWKKCKKHGFN